MKDRQVTHEGRRLIVPDSGTPFPATIYREKDGVDYEGIIEEGTPYNVESVLPDTLAESLGLNPEADPTPADALQAIAQALADWVDKTQSMIVIGQSSSQGLTTTETTLILGGTRFMNGNKLTRSGNGVLIGSGVNYVEVSGQMYINAGLSTGDTLTLSAVRNSGGDISKISSLNTKCAGAMCGMALSPALFSVSEGDIIYLQACNASSARGTVANYTTHTFLTVKVIA